MARYNFLVFLALERLVINWKECGKDGGAVTATGCPFYGVPEQQSFVTESLHPPGHPVKVAVLRDTCTIPAFACRG